ncbi:MAG: patatin-like phospholipase family protein [Deltaproteobacteria bacterium]|nr:patatin-like phospholipase family protein [Deltaproteobacteria bacterium]
MAISIVQKSSGRPQRSPRVALVLSGGAVSGGAFKIGGLIALEHLLRNCRVTDFDVYVGISAGSLIAAPLAAGLPPGEILAGLMSTSERILPFGARDFYWPNVAEFAQKGTKAVRDGLRLWPRAGRAFTRALAENRPRLAHLGRQLLEAPSWKHIEELQEPFVRELMSSSDLPHLLSYVPSGVFSNTRIERWVRVSFERNRLPNSFPLLQLERSNSLYVEAVNLDTGDAAVFGPDEDASVTISEAVQASTALPGFYRPVKLGSTWYIDGSVKHTAPMEVARRKGADLIICYNPFRPYHQVPTRRLVPNFESLAEMGLVTVLNQSVRTMIHSRLALGIEEMRNDPSFQGDVLVVEPAEDDAEFFSMNPLAFWKRAEAARRGYRSAKLDFERSFLRLRSLLAPYGLEIDLTRLEEIDEELEAAGNDDGRIVRILQKERPRPSRLRLVRSAS